jgi:dimethylhistidine N-methyltransferase
MTATAAASRHDPCPLKAVVTPSPSTGSADARRELISGLLAPQAHTSPKYLYDRLGSRLFEAITELPEYYPTRTEAAIFDAHAVDMARAIGAIDTLVDLGAGNCAKALRLIPALAPNRYVAVDISADFLADATAEVQRRHPALDVIGLGLDFSASPELPAGCLRGRSVFFYPGSSIGNFSPEQARRFLKGLGDQAADGGLLIGVDLVKPLEVLEPAYDDALGVTAAFNLNLLRHLNHLIGSNFNPRDWCHVAFFNRADSRIEMHLEARHALTVGWPGGERRFAAGERLHTENSYKYSVESFSALLRNGGFSLDRHWLDEQGWFAVFWAQR